MTFFYWIFDRISFMEQKPWAYQSNNLKNYRYCPRVRQDCLHSSHYPTVFLLATFRSKVRWSCSILRASKSAVTLEKCSLECFLADFSQVSPRTIAVWSLAKIAWTCSLSHSRVNQWWIGWMRGKWRHYDGHSVRWLREFSWYLNGVAQGSRVVFCGVLLWER